MTIWCIRFACWIPKATNTHRLCSTQCFTLHYISFYVHCLSCLSYVRYRYDTRTVSPNIPSILSCIVYFFLWSCNPTRTITSSFTRFLDHTKRRITPGRTPLDESPARRRDLYLTTLNTQRSQQTNIHVPAGFEPATHQLSYYIPESN